MTPLVHAFIEQGRLDDCPIIDLHAHTDPFRSIYFPDPEPEGIIRTMDRCNVRYLATVPHCALSDPAFGNPFMLDLLARYPERLLGYWYYSPQYPEDLEEAFRRPLETPGVLGYKVHPPWCQSALDSEGFAPLFAHAHAHKLIVLAHTWGRHALCGARACRAVAERYPEMRFLLGHSCWGEWDEAIALARECPHVYLELTAVERAPGIIDRFVHAGCADKIIFGTDLPWFNPHFTLGCVLFADIDDDARRAILYRNAERLLAERGVKPALSGGETWARS